MIFELWLAPQLKTTKFIPIFLLESPCIARDSSKTRDILFLDIILTGKTCPRQMGIRQIISSNIFDIIKFEMVITKVCFVNSCFLFADIVSPNRRKHPLQTISYKSAPSKEFVHCPRCRGQVNFLSFKHGAL